MAVIYNVYAFFLKRQCRVAFVAKMTLHRRGIGNASMINDISHFRRRRLVGIASGVDAISHFGRRRLDGTTSGVVNTSHFSIGADAGPLR